jgi:hypothetical protein
MQCEPSIQLQFEFLLGEGFKEVGCFLFMRYPLVPVVFLEESLSEMDMFLVCLKVLSFHVRFHLVQTWSHSFCFGFLLSEEVQQCYFHGNLGRTPTWSSTNDTQPFRNSAHEFCSFIILWCNFSLLHHEGLEGVEEG